MCMLLRNEEAMSKKITIHYEEKPLYDITIEHSFAGLSAVLQELDLSQRRICVVSDTNVAKHYLEEVRSIAGENAKEVYTFTFPAGEQSKNTDTVGDLYKVLIEAHFDRKDILLALGGGVVGDLTGFAASTYLRGIRVVQIPTSLLSMVDSSIGGKTGVDFRGYKNMVGAFFQPSAVYMNLSTLKTLSDAQYFSGFGEIIKHGLIKDAAYFQSICEHLDALKVRDMNALEEIVAGSCQIKRSVVEKDPKEKGERALLNYGHTLGHAIEKLMDFSLLHGECVSLGTIAASKLSLNRNMITKVQFENIVSLLRQLCLPVTVSNISAQEIINISKNDKKMDAGQIRFILLNTIGEAIITTDVTDQEMTEALEEILC